MKAHNPLREIPSEVLISSTFSKESVAAISMQLNEPGTSQAKRATAQPSRVWEWH